MVTTYNSIQYGYLANPELGGRAYGECNYRPVYFNWAAAAAGEAGDMVLLPPLPPRSIVYMHSSYILWSGFTSGATLSIGWQAYTDMDGVTQALSATGLMNALVSGTGALWSGGMLIIATPNDFAPTLPRKVFNNRSEVQLYLTIGTQVPSATAVLEGALMVANS